MGFGRKNTDHSSQDVLEKTIRYRSDIRRRFLFLEGSVKSLNLIRFLKMLLKENHQKIITVWDNLSVHKSKFVKAFLKENKSKIQIEFLPPYAPELNPQEYIWCHWKRKYMANFCPDGSATLI